MIAVAETAPDRRPSDREAVRWIICFIVAAAVHGVVALSLMMHFSKTLEDSGIDAPVVLLDLPESLVPSIAPVQDLPPGPMEQEESQAVPPPPKEEIRPPEPEAEVALPKLDPEPPKPEPPAEEKQATAPAPTRTPPNSVIRWQSALATHIQQYQRYPASARARGESGVATVTFTIDHEGRLVRSSIVQSSGSAALDQETLAALARALPMPRPPEQASEADLTFVMPMRFNIR
jgi:protein TonB